MNGTAEGGGGLAEDEEMPVQHELGEELAFTGRWVVQATWQTAKRFGSNLTCLWHMEIKFEYEFINIYQSEKTIWVEIKLPKRPST